MQLGGMSSIAHVGMAGLLTVGAAMAGCGGGGASPPKPPLVDTLRETACRQSPYRNRPLLVGWLAHDRTDLQTDAEQNGVVAVSYQGCALKRLACHARKHRYKYTPSALTDDGDTIATMAQLYARIPVTLVNFEAALGRNESIRYAAAFVGAFSATDIKDTAKVEDLGLHGRECDAATHVISGYKVGAFEFEAQSARGIDASTDIGGAKAKGTASESASTRRAGGDLAVCLQMRKRLQQDLKYTEESPPLPCAAITELMLTPITRSPGDMALLEPHAFTMGSPENDERAPSNEKPEHTVTLMRGFWMDRTEVTAGAYEQCVRVGREAGGCAEPQSNPWTSITPTYHNSATLKDGACNYGKRPTHPMNCVNWAAAAAYCKWAGKRLPTEEEWEYAARGTTGRKYPWGMSRPAEQLLRWNYASVAGKVPGTEPVGSFSKGNTPEGLSDMVGNVSEWTASEWCEKYGDQRSCISEARAVRGGNWWSHDVEVSATARVGAYWGTESDGIGFRCVRP
jgi:formylglycine-generating enzyme required for sulfatase activity